MSRDVVCTYIMVYQGQVRWKHNSREEARQENLSWLKGYLNMTHNQIDQLFKVREGETRIELFVIETYTLSVHAAVIMSRALERWPGPISETSVLYNSCGMEMQHGVQHER